MIILYNPQSSANRKPILPMSLLALAAVIEPHYSYQIVDGNLCDEPLATLNDLIADSETPCVLAVTVMPGPQLQQALPLCRQLKLRHPQLIVIWGGYFPTQHWDVCLREPAIDYVVRGHGEYAFLQLLSAIFGEPNAPAPDTIAGVAFRDADAVGVTNPLAPIPHPRRLPPWPFDSLPLQRYIRPTFLGRRTLGYHSSYGCPFFCNFCAVVNMVNGRWLPQTAAQVADIAQLYRQRWNVDAIEFYDNNFFTHEQRTAEFSERIRDYGLAWWGEGRVDTLEKYDDATWQAMADSGLRMIFMGAESGSAETLQRMHKGGQMHPDRTLAIVERMQRFGIVPELSFVLGNPPDPLADALQTMRFIRQTKQISPQAEIIMYLYTPVPLAGDLYDEARASGFKFPETLDEWVDADWSDFAQRRSDTLPWIQATLRTQMRDFERVLNAYFPTSTNPRLQGARRGLLRTAASWRYHSRIYRYPYELRLLQRLLAYQRPETSGF